MVAEGEDYCPNCGHGVMGWTYVCPGCNQIPWETQAGQKVLASRRRAEWMKESLPALAFTTVVLGLTMWSAVSAWQAGLLKPHTPPSAGSLPSITKEFNVEQYRGKFVLLNFWASWCGPCHEEIGVIRNLYSEIGSHPQVKFVGVSFDYSRDAMTKFLRQHHVTWPQVFEGKGERSPLKKRYGVQGIPYAVLLGPAGDVLSTYPAIVPFMIRSELESKLNTRFERFSQKGQGQLIGRLSYNEKPLAFPLSDIEIEMYSRDTNERVSPQFDLAGNAIFLRQIPFAVYNAYVTAKSGGVTYKWDGLVDVRSANTVQEVDMPLLREIHLLEPVDSESPPKGRVVWLSSPIHFIWELVPDAKEYAVAILPGGAPASGQLPRAMVTKPQWEAAVPDNVPEGYYFIRIEAYSEQRKMVGLCIFFFRVGHPSDRSRQSPDLRA